MPDSAPSPETFFQAFGLLSHLYLTPVLLAAIIETHPGTRGVLIDQPEVLPDAARLLSARGVADGAI